MTDIKLEGNMCRVCLESADEEEMQSIYERDPLDESLCLYEKIETCGGIEILTDPELPSRICSKCNAVLAVAHKFRIICKKSDHYLRKFVFKTTPSPATTNHHTEDNSNEFVMGYDDEGIPLGSEKTIVLTPGLLEGAESSYDETQTTIDYEGDEEHAGDQGELWLSQENRELDESDIIEEDLLGGEGIDNSIDDGCGEIEVDDGGGVEDYDGTTCDDSLEMCDGFNAIIENETTKYVNNKKPAKTLDISSDGAAVIRVRRTRNTSKEKQLHICDVCGNSYPRKYALEAHMRRHRDERPFECEICHQAFHLNFQLTRHIRKHAGVRPFMCQYCNRSFADRSTMIKHERIHRNERPYSCETCGKSFTYSSVLKVHQLTHTGEKPFNCGICGKRFSRAHHLRAHLETLLHQSDPRSKVLLKQIRREEDISYVAIDEYGNSC